VSDQEQSMKPRPSKALLDEVNQDLDSLAQTRRRTLIGMSILLLVSLGGVIAYWASEGSPMPRGMGELLHSAVLIAFIALALVFYALALGIWFPARRQLWVWGVAGVVGWMGLLVVTAIGYDQLGSAQGGYFCLAEGSGIGVILGGGALLLGGSVLRKRAPTGGLVGLATGIFSLALLHVVCIDTSVVHLLFWHGATPILSALLVTAGWVLLRPDD